MKCPNCKLPLRKKKEKGYFSMHFSKGEERKSKPFIIITEVCPGCGKTRDELEAKLARQKAKLDSQKTRKCPKCGNRIRRGRNEVHLIRIKARGKEELVGITSVSNAIWKCRCGFMEVKPGGINILALEVYMGGGQRFFPPDWRLLKTKEVLVKER